MLSSLEILTNKSNLGNIAEIFQNMSSDLEWADEEKQIDYCGLLEVPRESGDGESKEASPHTSASEDDNQETKQALIDVNRKVERRKDKKISKIPVWQAKASHHADVAKSTYGNSCHSQQLDFAEKAGISEEIFYKIRDKRHQMPADSACGTLYDELELNMSNFAPIANSAGCNESDASREIKLAEDNVANLDNTNVSEIEKEKLECGLAAISESLELKQSDTEDVSGILKGNGDGPKESPVGSKTDVSSPWCLSPRAPLSCESLDTHNGSGIIKGDGGSPMTIESSTSCYLITPHASLSSENLDDHILEAPEGFRSLQETNALQDAEPACSFEMTQSDDAGLHLLEELADETAFLVLHTDIGEPEQCRTGPPARDHDKANTPETNVCGRESNKDMAKNAERGIETGSASGQEPKPLQICMTNEGKHRVIQLEDRKVNANGCAAPRETMGIMRNVGDSRRVFAGGAPEDNDQIQNASETKLECVGGGAANILGFNCPNGTVGAQAKEVEYVELRNGLGKLVSRSSADAKAGGIIEACRASIDGSAILPSASESCVDNGCLEGHGVVNGPNSSVSNIGAYACAGNEQTLATAKASIAIGVARCAQAPRCSRISTATVSTADSSKSSNCSQKFPQVDRNVTEKCHCQAFSSDRSCPASEIASGSDDTQEEVFKTESVDSNGNSSNFDFTSNRDRHLIWEFKNGRLVFDSSPDESECASGNQQSSRLVEVSQCHSKDAPPLLRIIEECAEKLEKSVNKTSPEAADTDTDEVKDVLFSRDLNRRVVEGRSRLKHLENKLKEAGITDGKANAPPDLNQLERDASNYKSPEKQVNTVETDLEISENKEKAEQVVDKLTESLDNEGFDDNQNVVVANDLKSETHSGSEEEDLLPDDESADQDFAGGSFCEFDVRQVGSFSGFSDSEFFVVYDELEDSSSEDECEHEHYHIISEMRGDGSMGTDGDRAKQHNPDRENLKSLLKKPGRGRDVKKNRVVFNENKNEFFDADYIILIREECDYDDEEDDGVCTCNEHEMVRLTCCEPNCNCNLYEGYSDPTPQSPKFAPPLEFVDAVTLSPPEGYKDMELGEQQLFALQQMARRGQRTAVCRDCSATHEDDGEGSQSDNEDNCEAQSDHEDAREEAEKTDQSQQTTPTTPPAENESPNQHQYIMETVTMTTVTERRIMREMEDEKQRPSSPNLPPGGSPISGILKGGRLWKQHSQEVNNARNIELQQATDSSVTSDEESNGNRRSVRFIESNENKRDVCDGAVDKPVEETAKQDENEEQKQTNSCNNSVSPESTEMMLTFKLGNHILISNNSLKPNSAVRQLFPCSKPLSNKPGESDSVHQYLVTAESLRAFEEAKRSKLPQIIQSDETDESIKRAIERNTLRRSLIRYEPRPKKKEQKTDNSLVERIKQLTCDVDDVIQEPEDIPQRASPPGEEARKSPEVNHLANKNIDKSFSPSSSSTASSNSSSVSSTYKKITDLFAKREKPPDIQNNTIIEPTPKALNQLGPAPDLGNTGPHQQDYIAHHCPVTKANSTSDARKQFLSTLAPLTACVSGTGADDHYYHISHHSGDRSSVTSSVGTEYSLEDIDEGLKNEDDDSKRNAPDVVVGTPSASESGDELAMFVQQDASRIERIKKKYQQDNSEDDEHDDYGFNKRPSVRGIKPRFGTTTEILQQIQNQMQPPQSGQKTTNTHVAWPYYSEASLSGLDNNKSRNINQSVPQFQYTYVTEEMKTKMYVQHYRPTTLVEDNIYQNCANQRCNREVTYKANVNHVHSPIMRIGGGCSELYHQAVPVSSRSRNGRPESPPPFDVARNVHQTMVYIPYNHIESYQPSGCVSPNPQYASNEKCYTRVVNQNQINRYAEPMYHNQPRMPHPPVVDETHYQVNVMKQIPKPMIRLPYPLPSSQAPPHLLSSRSDSPLPGQFSTARSTQTSAPTVSTCNYYPQVNPRYRPAIGPVIAHAGVVWNGEGIYANKVNRHSFPVTGPRYPAPDSISLTDSESQYSGPVPNGFRQSIETTFSAQKDSVPNSPTKPRFIERGVPEGAASVSPQDSTSVAQSTSTMTSPTSPQNPQQANPKPLFYAMNV